MRYLKAKLIYSATESFQQDLYTICFFLSFFSNRRNESIFSSSGFIQEFRAVTLWLIWSKFSHFVTLNTVGLCFCKLNVLIICN